LQKRKTKEGAATRSRKAGSLLASKSEARDFIPGPKLRAKLGISAVTLWRWRHDEESGFPTAKVIKGRLYLVLAGC
jgi:hypothetical protein